MCAFRSDHLALNNQLMCSSMQKANSSTLSFLQVPIFLWMADPVVFCITFAYIWVLSLFSLHLDSPISEAFVCNSDITRRQNLTQNFQILCFLSSLKPLLHHVFRDLGVRMLYGYILCNSPFWLIVVFGSGLHLFVT